MEVQPQLILLQKTLLNVEGLGRQLDPDLDLWSTAKPYLEDWMRERMGPEAAVRKVQENLPRWVHQLPEIPGLVADALRRTRSSERHLEDQRRELRHLRRELREAGQRNFLGIVGAALLVSAALVYGLDGYQPTMLWSAPLMTWLLGILGVTLLLLAWPRD